MLILPVMDLFHAAEQEIRQEAGSVCFGGLTL